LKVVARELVKYKLDLVAVQGGQRREGRPWMGRGLYIFLWSREWRSSVRDRFFCT
jgi:hypothetical protein